MANRKKNTPEKRAQFLKVLRERANVTEATRACNVVFSTVYTWRKEDPEFAKEWDDAVKEAVGRLEQEAWRRAAEGWEEPVFHRGEKVGGIRKYSDTLLIFLLKGHAPEKYRERHDVRQSGGITVTVDTGIPRDGEDLV